MKGFLLQLWFINYYYTFLIEPYRYIKHSFASSRGKKLNQDNLIHLFTIQAVIYFLKNEFIKDNIYIVLNKKINVNYLD